LPQEDDGLCATSSRKPRQKQLHRHNASEVRADFSEQRERRSQGDPPIRKKRAERRKFMLMPLFSASSAKHAPKGTGHAGRAGRSGRRNSTSCRASCSAPGTLRCLCLATAPADAPRLKNCVSDWGGQNLTKKPSYDVNATDSSSTCSPPKVLGDLALQNLERGGTTRQKVPRPPRQ